MIVLFAGFGPERPYVGQMRHARALIAPGADITYLIHNAPINKPKYSSYLCYVYSKVVKSGTIFVSVIDPRVDGPSDRPMISARGNGCSDWTTVTLNGSFAPRKKRQKFGKLTKRLQNLGKISRTRYLSTQCSQDFDDFIADRNAQARTKIKQFDWPNDLN